MSAVANIQGIIGACLTPFGEDGAIDYAALEREIDFIVADADAISIAAVEASEYTVLSGDDRRELMRRGAEMVGGRRPVILGASAPSPRLVLELAEHAARCGADLVQVLMPLRPWGGQPTTGELVAFFEEVARRSPLPLVAYHNPGPGSDPPLDAFIRLSEIDGVLYFKESSRDITKITRLIEEIERSGKAHYFTTMQPLLTTLIMGGSGATMPPPGTRIGAKVVRAFREGNLTEAARWQRCYSIFPGKWGSYGLPPVMKVAMRELGIDLGDPLPPYVRMSPAHEEELRRLLPELGLVGDAASAPAATAAR